jgi:hypothetical protein
MASSGSHISELLSCPVLVGRPAFVRYYAIVRDCTGETTPFATREEAQQYADSEAAAARELFPDDHVNLHVTIFPKLQSMRQRLIVRPTDE